MLVGLEVGVGLWGWGCERVWVWVCVCGCLCDFVAGKLRCVGGFGSGGGFVGVGV